MKLGLLTCTIAIFLVLRTETARGVYIEPVTYAANANRATHDDLVKTYFTGLFGVSWRFWLL